MPAPATGKGGQKGSIIQKEETGEGARKGASKGKPKAALKRKATVSFMLLSYYFC